MSPADVGTALVHLGVLMLLFTALGAASSLSSTTVPLALTFMVGRWRSELGVPVAGGSPPGT